MTKYQLVNPYIEGEFEKSYSAKSPSECAEKVWDNLSGYLTGNVPKFAFTLQKESDGKLYHFLVKEKVKGDLVDYSISQLNLDLNKDVLSNFSSRVEKINRMSQAGGKKSKKHDDDDSSSSEDLDELYNKVMAQRMKHQNQPILYWWYTPSLYEYVVGSVFVPTFVVPLTPYVEIYPLSTAFWG